MNYDEEDRIRYHYIIIEYVGLASESSEAIPGDDAASIVWSTLEKIDDLNILDMDGHKKVFKKALQIYQTKS